MTARPNIPMRAAALRIVRRLRDAGHVALFAGGCVRDMLRRRRPADYDVATDAPPQRIIELFPKTQKVGVQFGVVIVGLWRHWVEVATFRSDGAYRDGRHPEAVRFSTPEEDARRRDFTINGMFFDPIARRVIDYVGGEDDLRTGVIRAIGDPVTRFAEDHLRMLRAVRFAARFGFAIEPATRLAIERQAADIARVSRERICDELQRILTHPTRAAGWREVCAVGLLPHLWPGAVALASHAESIMARLSRLPASASFELGLAALLRPLSPTALEEACVALRTSNATRSAVGWLCARVDAALDQSRVTPADLKLLMARPQFDDLLHLASAELAVRGQPATASRQLRRRAAAIDPHDVAPPPLLTGDDLAQMDLPRGPIYRVVLEKVYYEQLNGTVRTHGEAVELARHLIAVHPIVPHRSPAT